MAITTWDEIRTAFHVAREGTVSGAAERLGVHHATIIRHVDALESRLGVRLFQRHARGYTATEAGIELMRVAQTTDDQFTQLAGRLKGQGETVTGELIVTSLRHHSAMLTPVLARFQGMYPGLVVRYLTDERLYQLQYGEAHVALRAGHAPQEPDNVVQPFGRERFALYAARDYVERMGVPSGDDDLARHVFVNHDDDGVRAPFYRWLAETVPRERVAFRTTDARVIGEAVASGAGIGFLSVIEADLRDDLVQVMAPRAAWDAQLWLVTHVDLHRTTKVRTFLNYLKQEAGSWPDGCGPDRDRSGVEPGAATRVGGETQKGRAS